MTIGTDSSGELFGNVGDANWASDVSEARNPRRERGDNGSGEEFRRRHNLGALMLKGMNLDMVVSMGIVGMESLGMGMRLMRKKRTLPCCFGEITLEMHILKWRLSGRTRSLIRKSITNAVAKRMIIERLIP
ncbi:uncharacterized protein LOC120143704 [Hibiscus syriacus]|uniref:uncharacterized protein LOC120143704 n=1 Tax=Hibiscus syriacus TaxID=106335 RepID=UPI001924D83B|nr:uncharacterized protein LOC120143704 [Hibiscus syriacus]